MKTSEFRQLINECVREVLAEEKAKKKKVAKKKIEEIIFEAELTAEDLNELFGLGQKKGDPEEVNKRFKSPAEKINAYLSFFGQTKNYTDEEKKEAAGNEKKMKAITSYLAILGDLVGYDNIKTTKMGAKIKDKDGKEIQLDLATAGNKGIASPGKVWQVKSKPGGQKLGSGAYGE